MTEGEIQLPPLLILPREYQDRLTTLYHVYQEDFSKPLPKHDGLSVINGREVIVDEREDMFWHLTHAEQKRGNDGVFDYQRSIRIHWIRPLIEGCDRADDVATFYFREGGGHLNKYIWHIYERFVIILKKNPRDYTAPCLLLLTAHYLDQPRKERQLERKYENRHI